MSTFCSEVVWGPKIFPLGPQTRRHVRSSRHVLIERKAESNAGGLHLLLIITCLTPLSLFCFCSSF